MFAPIIIVVVVIGVVKEAAEVLQILIGKSLRFYVCPIIHCGGI